MPASLHLIIVCGSISQLGLFGTPSIRPHHPLILSMWLINRPKLDLIQFQLESGTTLCQCDRFHALWLLIHVMPKADEIVFVSECHDTFAVILCSWEQVFQDVLYSLSKLCAEVVEYQMRVGF